MKGKSLLLFVSGLAIGGGAGYFITNLVMKKKHEEEIVSIKATYEEHLGSYVKSMSDYADRTEKAESELNKELEKQAENNVNASGDEPVDYTKYYKEPIPEEEMFEVVEDDNEPVVARKSDRPPYVIFPEELGSEDGYEVIELSYYSDGVLADDQGHRITDPDKIVGKGNLKRIGEYERGSVFIRNEQMGCDFQVVECIDTYEEYLEEHPELEED